jgi:biotin carboxyl carrier protein
MNDEREGLKVKLRITIDGKAYEAEVEILEAEDAAPGYAPYSPASAAHPLTPTPAAPTQSHATNGNGEGEKIYRSPVTGLVIKVNVESGQTVQPNDLLVVLEAMKMETQVTATHAGTVKSVQVIPGNSVKLHQVLLDFE